MKTNKTTISLLALAAVTLSACGGGGGGIASAPSPGPAPTTATLPSPLANDTSVEVLDHPASQELAVATSDNPIRIRYDAARNIYEVKAAGFDWSALTDPPDPNTAGPNKFFDIADQSSSGWFSIEAHHRSSEPNRRYRYSNLATWATGDNSGPDWGNFVALGAPTPASGVPVSGSASFQGFAKGQADIPNDAWGAVQTTPLEGTVNLNFDFAAGSLSGSFGLASACDCAKYVSTGTIAFSNTAFAPGSQTFSGGFATSVAGINAFEGLFTGPGAEELIGSWSLPFLFEGATHQAWGAWIAKRGN